MFGNKAQIGRNSLRLKSRIFAQLAAAFALGTILFMLPSTASATMITGTAFLGGTSVLVIGTGGTGSCIDFYTMGNPTTCAATPATVSVNSFVQPGSNFPTGSNGTIQDLSGATSLMDFISITVGGTVYMFDLSGFLQNSGSAATTAGCFTNNTAPGDTCDPVNSAFQFTNGNSSGAVANTVYVGLTFAAEGYTGNSGSGETAYTGVITTQVAGNINTVLNNIAAGGYETSSVSIELFPTNVPEPATFGTIGAGLLGLSFLLRKRMQRA